MPGGDGTGPMGRGAMTGWGRGWCRGGGAWGGPGRGSRWAGGRGLGWGRTGRWAGEAPWDPDTQRRFLEAERVALEGELEDVRRRLEGLRETPGEDR